MITYLYWTLVVALAVGILFVLGLKAQKWRVAIASAVVLVVFCGGVYYFGLQQIFVKRYGGVMTVHVQEGLLHLGATWKDDNLWIENYNPKTNTCIFAEYSKGNLLQGKVTIENCNPLLPR